MKIKVTVDSSSDLENNYVKENNISVAPLTIFDATTGKVYSDGELENEELLDLMDKKHDIKTSCPSLITYENMFTSNLKDYENIIHLSMSSQMSSSYGYASKIAEEIDFKRIKVIDTKHLTISQALIVKKLIDHLQKTNNLEEILNWLDQEIERTELLVILSTTKYALKGGRVKSFGSKLMDKILVKPCLQMEKGKPKPILEMNLNKNADLITANKFQKVLDETDLDKTIIFGTTGDVSELKDQVNTLNLKKDLNINYMQAASVITSHVGKGTVALAYQKVLKKRS